MWVIAFHLKLLIQYRPRFDQYELSGDAYFRAYFHFMNYSFDADLPSTTWNGSLWIINPIPWAARSTVALFRPLRTLERCAMPFHVLIIQHFPPFHHAKPSGCASCQSTYLMFTLFQPSSISSSCVLPFHILKIPSCPFLTCWILRARSLLYPEFITQLLPRFYFQRCA